jgi:hypothetical protein
MHQLASRRWHFATGKFKIEDILHTLRTTRYIVNPYFSLRLPHLRVKCVDLTVTCRVHTGGGKAKDLPLHCIYGDYSSRHGRESLR